MTAAIHVRARVSTADGTIVDRSFVVDPAATETPWFDLMAGLVDIGRSARDAYRQGLAMVGDQ